MLTQYCFSLHVSDGTRPRPEWGYWLYAALLDRLPAEFGASVHNGETTPISQFVSVRRDGGCLWTVNLLGEDSENAVAPALDAAEAFALDNGRLRLTVEERRKRVIPDADALLQQAARSNGLHTLIFRTAAAFKSQGRYVSLPTERLILQSLLKKWNGSIPECPIEDEDGAGLDALANGLRFRGFRLRDGCYSLKGKRIPGFTGCLTLENRLEGFLRQIADALLIFSGFAGIGIKTALGMGGAEHTQAAPESPETP